MHFVFYDDYKPGILSDQMVFDAIPLLGGVDLSYSQGVVEYLIANFDQLRPKVKEFCSGASGLSVGSVRLRAPVPRPCQLLCALRNYPDRMARPGVDFFLKSPASIIGPGDTVELPEVPATVFHHEAELAVIIKRPGRKIPADQAMDYVFGYTGLIDVSARDIGNSYYMKKSFVTFAPMGPTLVTADEIPDPYRLRVRLWVNDILRQDFTTADMVNRIEQLIEVSSSISTLCLGDVIATGTQHEGLGRGLGPLQNGDIVTMEIERIGRMTLKVVDPLGRRWAWD